jgi:hypothetical protein
MTAIVALSGVSFASARNETSVGQIGKLVLKNGIVTEP